MTEKFVLSRDLPKEEEPAEKACKRCKVVKKTTDANFGLKFHGTRERKHMWHVDVCKACHSQAMVDYHERRRQEKVDYAAFREREFQLKVQAEREKLNNRGSS